MSKLGISTGTTPNDGTGDSLALGAVKINSNFNEIYNYFGDGTDLNFSKVSWISNSAGIHTLSNVGLGTTNPRFSLEIGSVGTSGTSLWVNGDARITGILTVGSSSISFDGSTNTIKVGTGITINGNTGIISATSIVLNGTTLSGSAVTSITAGSGISIDQSTGNVTITATGGGGGGENYWVSTAAGIHTLSNVGIGTTNPTSALTVTGSGASISQLYVTGISTFNNYSVYNGYNNSKLRIGPPGNYAGLFWYAGESATGTKIDTGSGATLDLASATDVTILASTGYSIKLAEGSLLTGVKLQTLGVGVTVTGTTFTNQLSVSGVSTFIGSVGIGTTNPTSALTVSGNVNISGVSTFNDTIEVGTGKSLTFGSAGANYLKLYSDGSNTYINQQNMGKLIIDASGTQRTLEITDSQASQTMAKFIGNGGGVELYNAGFKKFETIGTGVTVTGTTFTNQLSVSGFSTFIGNVRFANSSGVSTYVHNIGPSYITGYDTSAGYQNDVYLNFSSVTSNYILRNVGIGTTNPTSALTVGAVGSATTTLTVNGYATIDGVTIKAKNPGYGDNIIISGNPAPGQYTFTGGENVAIGWNSFIQPGAAKQNVALGNYALQDIGDNSTLNDWTGNTGIGYQAGQYCVTTLYNTLIGWRAGRYITSGNRNVILGSYDGNSGGLDIRTSSNNVVLSDGAGNIKLYANSSGNIGIGTTNPTDKLTVKGNTSLETLNVSGITSTKDLIVYGNGNDSGSISTVALMSRNNYIDFGPAIPNTSAPQQFALRLGSDRATGTFGLYTILGASWTNPSGSVSLNNWDGTSAIGINDTAVSVTARPLAVGTATSTGTASQALQVTGGAYVSESVGIGTTNPTSKLTVTGNTLITGVTTITGNLNAPGNYYVKLARLTNQTVLNGTDTLIGFATISDPNNWYSGITTSITPTVAGTYHVNVMLNWQAGSVTNDQTNIQIRKNGTTFALSQVGIQTFAYTQNACGIVTMNGATDYIEFTAYTSNPTSQVVNGTADGAWTKMEIFKIN